MTALNIALVGELNPHSPSHRAIPPALDLCARALEVTVTPRWVSTDEVEATSAAALSGLDGIWCVPSTPYRNTQGALRAIGHARQGNIAFLGTCGGFQYTILEYARNVLQWHDAGHGELEAAGDCIIAPLACALIDVAESIVLLPGTKIHSVYAREHITEEFRCRYAVNPLHVARLFAGALRISAHDGHDSVRAVELPDHPFFVATLFQPERLALAQAAPPLVKAFLQSALQEKLRAPREM